MSFDPGALYTSERGIARLVTKEEAHELLRESEEKGLVHMGSNTSNFMEFLCNCCSCHCVVLKNINEMGEPIWAASSGYLAEVEVYDELSHQCCICVEMCPMDAVSINEGKTADVDEFRCIGCGVCARRCPAVAISMNPCDDVPSPLETPRDLRNTAMGDFHRVQAEQK
nr:hypothetical protein [Desulfobacterales bacterium]